MSDSITRADLAAHTDRIVDAIDRLTKAVAALSLDIQAADLIARHAGAMKPDTSATDDFGMRPLHTMRDDEPLFGDDYYRGQYGMTQPELKAHVDAEMEKRRAAKADDDPPQSLDPMRPIGDMLPEPVTKDGEAA